MLLLAEVEPQPNGYGPQRSSHNLVAEACRGPATTTKDAASKDRVAQPRWPCLAKAEERPQRSQLPLIRPLGGYVAEIPSRGHNEVVRIFLKLDNSKTNLL